MNFWNDPYVWMVLAVISILIPVLLWSRKPSPREEFISRTHVPAPSRAARRGAAPGRQTTPAQQSDSDSGALGWAAVTADGPDCSPSGGDSGCGGSDGGGGGGGGD